MKIIKTTIEADSVAVISEINAIFNALKRISPDRKFLTIAEIKKELAIKATDLQIADYLVSIGGKIDCVKGKYFLNGWFKPFWVLAYQSKGRYRFLAKKGHANLQYGTDEYNWFLEWSKTTEEESVKFESEQEAIDFRNSEMAIWNNVKIWQYADFL